MGRLLGHVDVVNSCSHVRVRHLARAHLMEKQMPGARNFFALLPLGNAAFGQSCELENFRSPAHCFDDVFGFHATSLVFYTRTVKHSKPKLV